MHKALSFLGSAFVFCFAAPAQDYSIPPNHETMMGSLRGQHQGAFKNLRFQLLSGELQGSNKAHTWNSVSFRREQFGRTNTGRSWANVTLAISDHDYSLIGPTFSTNIVGTPTQVFSGTVNYPAMPAIGPTTLPTVWGHFAVADDLKYPFSTPVMHNGKWGVCLDWVMTGGTLANSATWGALTQKPYYTDGDQQTLTPQDVTSRPRITDTTCRATGQSGAPQVRPYFITTAKNSASTKYPSNKLAFEFRAYSLQGGRTGIGIVSFDDFTAGTTFLGSCEKLYLDLNKPFIPFFFVTNASGGHTTSGAHVPFLPVYTGLPISTQGVWDDSVKGLQLSGRIFTRAKNQADPSKTKRNYQHAGVNLPAGRTGSPYTTLMPCVLLGK
jgi:hypothetical protein